MVVSQVVGVPQARWMIDFMENPSMDDDWGYPYDFGNHKIDIHPHKRCPISWSCSTKIRFGFDQRISLGCCHPPKKEKFRDAGPSQKITVIHDVQNKSE